MKIAIVQGVTATELDLLATLALLSGDYKKAKELLEKSKKQKRSNYE
jgi:hypothetical protein